MVAALVDCGTDADLLAVKDATDNLAGLRGASEVGSGHVLKSLAGAPGVRYRRQV